MCKVGVGFCMCQKKISTEFGCGGDKCNWINGFGGVI